MHSSSSGSTPLTLDGTVLKTSADLVILGVTFDAKMTFEKHLCSVSSAAAQRLGIVFIISSGRYSDNLNNMPTDFDIFPAITST